MSISQNFPTEGPNLNLNFTHSRTLDSRVTFSRPSAATCVNENGLLAVVPAGSPRFDHRVTVTENLLLYSEQFDVSSSWGAANVTVTANAGTSPTGTNTADLVTASITASDRLLGQFVSIPTNTASYTGSIYVKKSTYGFFSVGFYFAGGTIQEFGLTADLDAGTIVVNSGSVASFSMVPVGDGWFRIVFTQPNNGTNTSIRFTIRPLRATGPENTVASNALIWGAQIEVGTSATPYIPTVAAKVESIDVESMGLLVEEQRTNFLKGSRSFDSDWASNDTAVGGTYSAQIITNTTETLSPDGTNNAAKIIQANNGWQRILQGVSLNTNNRHTFSIFVKRGNSNVCVIEATGNFNAGGRVQWNFNSETFTEFAPTNWSNLTYVKYPNGWYCLSGNFLATSSVGTTGAMWFFPGDDYNGLPTSPASFTYVYGFQLEEGSFPTSYIPTTTATATRSPDIVSIEGAKFTSWFDPLEGTTVVETENTGTRSSNFSVPIAYRKTYSASSNTIEVFQNNGNFYYLVRTDPPQVDHVGFSVTPTVGVGSYVKYGFSYKQNDFSYFINNTLYTDTAGTLPTGLVVAAIGSNGGTYMNGRIKSIQYYPYRMSDLQLKELCR